MKYLFLLLLLRKWNMVHQKVNIEKRIVRLCLIFFLPFLVKIFPQYGVNQIIFLLYLFEINLRIINPEVIFYLILRYWILIFMSSSVRHRFR